MPGHGEGSKQGWPLRAMYKQPGHGDGRQGERGSLTQRERDSPAKETRRAEVVPSFGSPVSVAVSGTAAVSDGRGRPHVVQAVCLYQEQAAGQPEVGEVLKTRIRHCFWALGH